MHTADLLKLIDYNEWATDRILQQAARLTPEQYTAPANIPWGSIRGTFVHMLSAERTWRLRFRDHVSKPALREADYPTLDDVIAAWQEERAILRAWAETQTDDDLAQMLHYANSKGEPYEAQLSHILTHVINHGTQHRSEVAVLLTDYGYSPGDLDFIYFVLGIR